MIFDSHVHTTFSVDADTTIAQAIRAAEEKNVGLVITDHMDWHFVLGSMHVMNGREVDDTLYLEQDEREVYRANLQEAAILLETADLDAFAHVDYPLRTTSAELPYENYRAEFAALFDVLVRRNIVLELNSSRLADKAARANLLAIYHAYQKCGGRYVTLGSDAHEPQEIADNFAIAADFLQETGLIPVHFCKRQMQREQ